MTTTEPPPALSIADNKAAFQEALFKPVNGRTHDGYIVRATKTHVDFWARGKDYTITRRGVLAIRTKQEDGRTWYSYGTGTLHKSFMAECEFCDAMLSKFNIQKLR